MAAQLWRNCMVPLKNDNLVPAVLGAKKIFLSKSCSGSGEPAANACDNMVDWTTSQG